MGTIRWRPKRAWKPLTFRTEKLCLSGYRGREINWNLLGSFGTRVDRRLAPRTCEGGVPALAQRRGEYEFPAPKHQIEFSFCGCCSYSSHLFANQMRMTGSPRHQCAHWYHPPRKRGGQGRVPHRNRFPLDKRLCKSPICKDVGEAFRLPQQAEKSPKRVGRSGK